MKQRLQKYKNNETYNVEILNYFNAELQIKNTQSAIRNKLKDLSIELRGFKFVMTLFLEFKMLESDDETKYSTFLFDLKH